MDVLNIKVNGHGMSLDMSHSIISFTQISVILICTFKYGVNLITFDVHHMA